MKLALLAALLALSPVEGLLPDVGPPDRPFDAAQTGLLRTVAPLGGELFGVAFSADGRRLALGCGSTVRIFETESWKEVARLEPNPQSVFSVAFSPDGRRLAAGGFEGAVQIWDVESRKPARILAGHTTYVGALAWSPDGGTLLSGSHDGRLRVWEADGDRIRDLAGRQGAVFSAAFSADGRTAATGGGDGSVVLWRAGAWDPIRKLQTDAENLMSVQYVAGGRLAGISQTAASLWDASSGELVKRQVFAETATAARMMPDGRHAVTAGSDFGLRVLELAKGGPGVPLRHHLGAPTGIATHPAGKLIASIGSDRLLKVWGPKPGGMEQVRPIGFAGIQVGQGAVQGEVVVMAVHANTPAALAGLRQGDLMKSIGGRPVETPTDVVDLIRSYQEGEEAVFGVSRGGAPQSVRLKLAARPKDMLP